MIGSVFFVRNIELTESRYPLPHNKETKTRFPAYYQFYSDWHGGCRTYTTILWWWNAPVFRNLLLTTNVIGPVTTWRHHENWLTMIISFKNFTSWDEKHDDRKSESLKQCAKRMKIQAVINNKEKMTRHDEKGVKEWGNIKHWGKKKLRPPHGCNFKMSRWRKNDQVCTDKKSKGHSHNGMGERTVFYNPDL